MFNHVAIKRKQMSFVSSGGKFKLYTVPNGLLFSTPTQSWFSFERVIQVKPHFYSSQPFLVIYFFKHIPSTTGKWVQKNVFLHM
jgi:hypothetical protein